MRIMMLGMATAAGIVLAGLSAASAAPVSGSAIRSVGGAEGMVETVHETRYCRRLRLACEKKDARGETGEGNCSRYRRECTHKH
jgi:hypothetical protein